MPFSTRQSVQYSKLTARPVGGSSPAGVANGPVLVPRKVSSNATASSEAIASLISTRPSGNAAAHFSFSSRDPCGPRNFSSVGVSTMSAPSSTSAAAPSKSRWFHSSYQRLPIAAVSCADMVVLLLARVRSGHRIGGLDRGHDPSTLSGERKSAMGTVLTPFSYVILALVGEDGAGPHDLVASMRR